MAYKYYQSYAWLRRKYLTEKKSPEEIANICGVSQMTIYRYLRQYKLIK